MFSSVSNQPKARVFMGLSPAELTQLGTFQDYLRNLTEESEEAEDQKRSRDERIQRENLQQKNELHNTLFETLSDDKELQRKKEQDALDQKKRQIHRDLDRLETDRLLERRDQKKLDENSRYSEISVSSTAFSSANASELPGTKSGQPNAEFLPGISHDAMDGGAFPDDEAASKSRTVSENHSRSLDVIVGAAASGVTGDDPVSGVEPPRQTSVLRETSQEISQNRALHTLSYSASAHTGVFASDGGHSLNHGASSHSASEMPGVPQAFTSENGGSGREMQLLASFSGLSTRLAQTFRTHTHTKSISGSKNGEKNGDSSATAPGFTFAGLLRHDVENNADKDTPHTVGSTVSGTNGLFASRVSGANVSGAGEGPVSHSESDATTRETFSHRDVSSLAAEDMRSSKNDSGVEHRKAAPSFLSALNQVLAPRSHKQFSSDRTPENDFAAQANPSKNTSVSPQFASAGFRSPHDGFSDTEPSRSETTPSESSEHTQVQNHRGASLSGDPISRTRFLHRIANACLSAANQSDALRMKLHPEALGSLTLSIKLHERDMDVSFEVENEEAASILEEHFATLRERLESQGYSVASYRLSVGSTGRRER